MGADGPRARHRERLPGRCGRRTHARSPTDGWRSQASSRAVDGSSPWHVTRAMPRSSTSSTPTLRARPAGSRGTGRGGSRRSTTRSRRRSAFRRRRVRDVQAWLTRATGRRGADRRPLILHVHGGPYGATGPTPLFEDLMLAETGFHVLAPNPAGSTGFGEDYARSLFGRWGVPDTADLMASIDWAVAEGIADPDRIGVLGLSYGGYHGASPAGHAPRTVQGRGQREPVHECVRRPGRR